MNFSTNTWSIGIRIEHTGLLELSLEGLSVSLESVQPSLRTKFSVGMESSSHILALSGKFQFIRDQLILKIYWVFKFLQGYNYWVFEFSPHINKFMDRWFTSQSNQTFWCKYQKLLMYNKCLSEFRFHIYIIGKQLAMIDIAESVETYTLNLAVRNSRIQAYINGTTECSYWSIILVTLAESNFVRFKCSNYYRLLNLRFQSLQLVLKQHIQIHAGWNRRFHGRVIGKTKLTKDRENNILVLFRAEAAQKVLHTTLTWVQLRSDV